MHAASENISWSIFLFPIFFVSEKKYFFLPSIFFLLYKPDVLYNFFQFGVNDKRTTWLIDGQSPCIKDADHA